MSSVKPKLIKSIHYCEQTAKGIIKEYEDEYDLTNTENINKSRAIPLKDPEGRPLISEFGLWKFRDFQVI